MDTKYTGGDMASPFWKTTGTTMAKKTADVKLKGKTK